MILALALCIFLLPCMGLSFWSAFHRLNKIDTVFSFLNLSIGKCRLGQGCCRLQGLLLRPGGASGLSLPASPAVYLSLSPSGRVCGPALFPASCSFPFSPGIFQSIPCACLCFSLLAMEGGRGCLSSLTVHPRVTVQPPVHLWPHPSAGLLILLSLTFFIVNCKALEPKLQLSYQEAFYLCWCACALMLYAGEGGAWRQG